MLTVPTAEQMLPQGHATAIRGVRLAEANNLRGETFSVTISDQNGLLSASGAGVKGSHTQTLSIAGTLAQVNADLATLVDTDSLAAFDLISIAAQDSFGNKTTGLVNVGVSPNLLFEEAGALLNSAGNQGGYNTVDPGSATLTFEGHGRTMLAQGAIESPHLVSSSHGF